MIITSTLRADGAVAACWAEVCPALSPRTSVVLVPVACSRAREPKAASTAAISTGAIHHLLGSVSVPRVWMLSCGLIEPLLVGCGLTGAEVSAAEWLDHVFDHHRVRLDVLVDVGDVRHLLARRGFEV